MSVVEALGRCTVKGTRWQWMEQASVGVWGTDTDRLWTPITPGLHAVKATDLPGLAGLGVAEDDLADALANRLGDDAVREVRYYDRTFPSTIHRGRLARTLSEHAGQELLLARSASERRFIWSSPVSVLLRSELGALPGDVGRYRPNIVVDDRDDPLVLVPGHRLRIGRVVLELERELDRCLVINHDPLTGERDASLLRRLRPGALLGWGCRVLRGGEIGCGQGVVVEPPG